MEVKSVSESIPEDFEAPPSNRSNLQDLILEENLVIIENREVESEVKTAAVEHDSSHQEQSAEHSAIIENREVESEVKTAAVEHDSSHQEEFAVCEEATESLDVAVETQERSIEK